jgi:hypothetical protein
MSGSNALAAAKRRRVEGASKPSAPVARPNNSQQRPQSQPKASVSATLPTGKLQNPTNSNQRPTQNSNVVLQKNQFISSGMNQNNRMSSDEKSNNIFTIPPPPPGVNPLELLGVHHIFINKLASHLPPALENLGENFNTMSANCDNLNDRLEILEKNGASNGGASNGGASNDFESQKKIEELNSTITNLVKIFYEFKNTFVKMQSYTMEKELEHNKFKNDISSKNSELFKETENLRKQIIELQENVSELKSSKNAKVQEQENIQEQLQEQCREQAQDELKSQDNEEEKNKDDKQYLEQYLEQ